MEMTTGRRRGPRGTDDHNLAADDDKDGPPNVVGTAETRPQKRSHLSASNSSCSGTASSSVSSATNNSATNTSSSASSFTEMRRKLGSHRRSIKNRMKRMYNRTGSRGDLLPKDVTKSCELPIIKDADRVPPFNNNNNSSSSPSAGAAIATKRDRSLFGSLSRLRKSRTSVCIEDILTVKQKKPLFADKFTQKPFHLELKREMDKRFETTKKNRRTVGGDNVCHSIFYD